MKIPADDAPLADIVAFMEWNDRNGNWPERILHTDARIGTAKREGTISPPINADHVWYDWEGDHWYTDEEVRAQLLPILTEWRNEV